MSKPNLGLTVLFFFKFIHKTNFFKCKHNVFASSKQVWHQEIHVGFFALLLKAFLVR